MSPVQQLLPDHLQPAAEPSDDREALSAALSLLPAEDHQRILTDFILTARRCDITRDYGPLRHLNDSLFVTARLHSSEEYRAAIATALKSDMAVVTDLGDYLERLRGKTP